MPKAGAFNLGVAVPANLRLYAPEYLWNAEAGGAIVTADGKLSARASVFHMWQTDQQVSSGVQLDPLDPLSFIFITRNAARGRSYGAEMQFEWRPVSRIQASASLGLLHARFTEYQGGAITLRGRAPAHAPDYQYAVALEYLPASEGGLFARVDVQGSDGFYYGTSYNDRAPSYDLVNARVGYDFGQVRISAWIRNLFDDYHSPRAFRFGLEPPAFTPKLYRQAGEPRRFGATLEARF